MNFTSVKMTKPSKIIQLIPAKSICRDGSRTASVTATPVVSEWTETIRRRQSELLRRNRLPATAESTSQATANISALVEVNQHVPKTSQQSTSHASSACVTTGDNAATVGGGDKDAMKEGATHDGLITAELFEGEVNRGDALMTEDEAVQMLSSLANGRPYETRRLRR